MPWAAGHYVSGPPAGSLLSHVFAVIGSQPLCVFFPVFDLIGRDLVGPRFAIFSLRFIQAFVADFSAFCCGLAAFANIHVKASLSLALARQNARLELNLLQLSSS